VLDVTVNDEPREPRAARTRGRPPRISQDQVIAAAIEGNLETLTMRELAARLGVTHGALYRVVHDRDELLDMVSEVLVNRVLPADDPPQGGWRPWLARLAWAMHDEFLAVPGYATRSARPHRHNPRALGLLKDRVTGVFRTAGVSAESAEQSWYIFIAAMASWLAAEESPLHLTEAKPRYDLFLDVLLDGLPAPETSKYPRPE
jgi:AcrR family transcriptional regulator